MASNSVKFTTKFDPRDCIEGLDHYAVKIVTGGRYAVQKGAQVIYDETLRLVPVKSGLLRRSIYQVYSADNSVPGKVITYHIGWNTRKAPHGHLIEFGHWSKKVTIASAAGPIKPHWVPAHPFLRPAFYGKVTLALEVIKVSLGEKLGEEV